MYKPERIYANKQVKRFCRSDSF